MASTGLAGDRTKDHVPSPQPNPRREGMGKVSPSWIDAGNMLYPPLRKEMSSTRVGPTEGVLD